MDFKSLQEILEDFYKQEISVKVDSNWDNGWWCQIGFLGDSYHNCSWFDTAEECRLWLNDKYIGMFGALWEKK